MYQKQSGPAPIRGGRTPKSQTTNAFSPPAFAQTVVQLEVGEWFMVPKHVIAAARRYLVVGQLFMPDRSYSIRIGINTDDFVLVRNR
jgi:hypothetical protein